MKSLVKIEHWKVIAIYLVIYDFIVVNCSYLFALWVRFDGKFSAIPYEYLNAWKIFTPYYSVGCIIVFFVLRMYQSVWRFAGYSELKRVGIATLITTFFHIICITIFVLRMPISYYCMGAVVQFALVLAIRFSYRFLNIERSMRNLGGNLENRKRVMLIGAGAAGQMVVKDLQRAKEMKEKVVCIIDDNPNKQGRDMDGIPIVGGRSTIISNAKSYDIQKIYVAIPSANMVQRREIIDICSQTGCDVKILPGMYQLAKGDVTVNEFKEVKIEDLLGREPVKVDLDKIMTHLSGKVILITGGGGSIGSELCRQIASHTPKKLIIFDIYENNAYDIQLELKRKHPQLDLQVLIGSVRDSRVIYKVFETYRPDIVYHAAAHKHVPLMEDSPAEAIKNNALGTYKTAYAALTHGCKQFVLISTDKAVNPTNIMGASKRLCEMIVQSFNYMVEQGRTEELPQLYVHPDRHQTKDNSQILQHAKTKFVAVRFGNVLGSNGSVVPLFKKQIREGGPVTVTHPDVIRYFMTIPEAVSLVLQAGVYAKGGEIFVLDMGSPMKIDTLARNLIRLSGLRPDEDIKIKYTGLRTGEKLYEEKLMQEEGLQKTENEMIHIGKPIPFDVFEFLNKLENLMNAAYDNKDTIKMLTKEIVETYHPE